MSRAEAAADAGEVDLLVVGSGAAGLAAAVTAAHQGLRVAVLEKAPWLGGATAWSGGWMWVPGHPLARRAGFDEDPAEPRRYLRHELGAFHDPALVEAFLSHCGPMVEFFERHTALQFVEGHWIPDIHGDSPGAGLRGHQVAAAPLDGRRLGALLHRLRPPMRETSLWGLPIMAGPDLAAFLSAGRSWRSMVHVAGRVARHLRDLALHGRALQLVNGPALVARLALSAQQAGVALHTGQAVSGLLLQGGAVAGVYTGEGATRRTWRARRGVVLATGGFPHDLARRQRLFPRGPGPDEHLPLPPAECSGDGLRLGESVGAQVRADLASPVAWAPVSRVPYPDGRTGHFPHIIDRGKPGVIGVLADGRRFVNEAGGYHDYTAAMVAAVPAGRPVASWLVADHRFVRRYGLGLAKPFPVPLAPALLSGYLQRADTLAGLARRCGIDPQGLEDTVRAYNHHAERGEDPAFGRGGTAYNRRQGDPGHGGPNPCVAPIRQGPFYAVKVEPGCFGTFAGLRTDGRARVLDAAGQPIHGLWAAGADMASVMGGHYPSGGIKLGPAMTFGHIAGLEAAR